MNTLTKVAKAIKYSLISSVSASLLTVPVFAQEDGTSEKFVERISITGSRIKKAEFDQAAPVQVLKVDDAIKAGVNTVADLLQRTSMAGGQQLDGTYNSNSGNSNASEAPPSGGVGSSNIGLRGLSPERTLILVNGRRLGSSGVRGAPSQPDLSLLPLNMVDRIEVITEGASSIYGADAVAGVINVIMKNSYEGAEISANITSTKDGGGAVKQFSFVTGHEGDKSNFVFSLSYYERDRVKVGQRAGECITTRERDDQGNIYDNCENRFFNNAALNFSDAGSGPGGGDIFAFYTPGSTNIGVGDWSTGAGLASPSSSDLSIGGNGRDNYRYNADYHDQWDTFNSDLIQPVKRFTLALNGTYALDLFGGDEEVYYEGYYFHRHLTNQAASEQNLPTVPGAIPYEIDAAGTLATNPDGSLALVDNPLNPFNGHAMLVATIDELSQKRNVELDHIRLVGGIRGDFTFDYLKEKEWNYEMFASYDRGMGHQDQPVMHSEHLQLATQTLRLDMNGDPVCGVRNLSGVPDYGGVLTPQTCVPTNFFGPSFFSLGERNGGSFPDDEARDYFIATRTNRTVVEQVMYNAFASGSLFDFDNGGTALAAIGGEYRKDTISSAVDYLGAKGGNASENPLTEGDTDGSRDVTSLFAEISLPIFDGQEYADLLEVEMAVRYTDESNFGEETTTRARLTYKPVDWVILSGSYGTSFRAPNLREQFLADQFQGVSGSGDPCAVPPAANDSGTYIPANDARSQIVFDNCRLSGAEPTVLGLSGILNVAVTVGGNAADIVPETSENYTYSLKLTPELSDDFKMNFAITYYDIEVKNTIRSINGVTLMNRCYLDEPGLTSPFCDRVSRNGVGRIPALNFVNAIDASFVNVGLETSKGFDVNLDFTTDFDVMDLPVHMSWTNQYTQMTERDITIFEEAGADDLVEDFGYAKHRLVSNLSFDSGDFSWLLVGRYMSGTHADMTTATTQDCEVFIPSTRLTTGTDSNGDQIRPSVQPICDAPSAFYLDSSVTWSGDDLRVTAGINNVLDKSAPRINMAAGSNRANLVTSSGYDLFGQTYFVNATLSF